ncbi:MAG TPA: LD-carboxypeptidase [Ignavibacteriaceae bacterium]|nr:LD-carboxypeptidase [Ignavibacteriaceae bacterium]
MKRKNFIKSLSLASAASFLPSEKFLPFSSRQKKIIKPKKLKAGDTIALVTPGSYISEKELNDSIENLNSLGFKVVYNKSILNQNGYFSGNDKERAAELTEMFSRKDVDGIMCARGGYGCSRILPLLDYDIILDNPKVLIGYSDITALLYGIYSQTGLVCFHGPVGISTFNEFSVNYFKNVLVKPQEKLQLDSTPEENNPDPIIISSGKAEGELVGGNLSVAVSLIGTEYDIDTEDKIIFIEETSEEPYRVDRMLTQMIMSGKFEKAAGVALGIFDNCEPKKENPSFDNSFSLKEVLFDRLAGLGIPVVYGLSFGHIKNKFTLPFGIKTELNSDTKTLTLLEPAVV